MPTDLVEIDYGRITVESDDPLVRAEIRAARGDADALDDLDLSALDPASRRRADLIRAEIAVQEGDTATAESVAYLVLGAAGAAGDRNAETRARIVAVRAKVRDGRFRSALADLPMLRRECEDNDFRTAICDHLAAVSHLKLGDREQALDLALAAIHTFRACGAIRWEGWARNVVGLVLTDRGELDAAIAEFEQAEKLAAECGVVDHMLVARNNVALVMMAAERIGDAVAALRDALRWETGPTVGGAQARVLLALGLGIIGRRDARRPAGRCAGDAPGRAAVRPSGRRLRRHAAREPRPRTACRRADPRRGRDRRRRHDERTAVTAGRDRRRRAQRNGEGAGDCRGQSDPSRRARRGVEKRVPVSLADGQRTAAEAGEGMRYFNEHDPFAAAWLRELWPDATVDERSIVGEEFMRGVTIIETIRGAKNKHPKARFKCRCGTERIARATSIRRGLISQCVRCAKADGARRGALKRSLPDAERKLRDKWSTYKVNARVKGHGMDLSFQEFTLLCSQPCDYCGGTGGGVDRVDSAQGYAIGNVVPCCSKCNYGKRGMSRDDFLEWVRSVHEHQSFLQRNRSVLLRVVEQPDGRRGDSSGDYLRQVDCGSDSGRREVL